VLLTGGQTVVSSLCLLLGDYCKASFNRGFKWVSGLNFEHEKGGSAHAFISELLLDWQVAINDCNKLVSWDWDCGFSCGNMGLLRNWVEASLFFFLNFSTLVGNHFISKSICLLIILLINFIKTNIQGAPLELRLWSKVVCYQHVYYTFDKLYINQHPRSSFVVQTMIQGSLLSEGIVFESIRSIILGSLFWLLLIGAVMEFDGANITIKLPC